MRRVVIFTASLASLGVVTSVAVAWALCAFQIGTANWVDAVHVRHNGWVVVGGSHIGRHTLTLHNAELHTMNRSDSPDYAVPRTWRCDRPGCAAR